MTLTLIRAELRKMVRRPAFMVGAALQMATMVVTYSALGYQVAQHANGQSGRLLTTLLPDRFPQMVGVIAYPACAAVALVVGALWTGSDYGWGTLKTTLTLGPGRINVMLARAVTITLSCGVATLAVFAMAAICSVGVAAFNDQPVTWPAYMPSLQAGVATWLVLTCYAQLGLALGVVFRQPAAALGVGLVYLAIFEGIVVSFVTGLGSYAWVGKLFDGQNAAALLRAVGNGQTTPAAGPAIGPGEATLALALFLLAWLVVATVFQCTRDVT